MEMYFDERINDYVYNAGTPAWHVVAVEPSSDYTLRLNFVSGEKRLYNAYPLLEKSIYAPLTNLSLFLSARIEGDSVSWSDDIDIAPEHLYEHSKPIE